jgi:hypothetical protein
MDRSPTSWMFTLDRIIGHRSTSPIAPSLSEPCSSRDGRCSHPGKPKMAGGGGSKAVSWTIRTKSTRLDEISLPLSAKLSRSDRETASDLLFGEQEARGGVPAPNIERASSWATRMGILSFVVEDKIRVRANPSQERTSCPFPPKKSRGYPSRLLS